MGRMNFKEEGMNFLLNAGGGITSAAFNQGAKLSDTKLDDEPLNQVLIKGGLGIAIKWLFGNRRGAHEFVAGMNGHSAGAAADTYVINRLASSFTKAAASSAEKKANP
jgi:hypothetical protein